MPLLLAFQASPIRSSAVSRYRLHSLALAMLLALSGCASLPADRGLSTVNTLVNERDRGLAAKPLSIQNNPESLDQQVDALLAKPLTGERAVGIALLKNPTVRIAYANMGLNQADWVEASRLSNPVLSLSVLSSNTSGDSSRLGYGLVQNFTDILFARNRSQLAKAELVRLQTYTALSLQRLAADVTEAYFEAVGSAQIAQMRLVTAKAASASAELAKRFHEAGNINALELAREQAAAEQALLSHEAAQAEADEAKIVLNSLMGLPAFSSWILDSRLPLPVPSETSVESLVELGLKQRLDLFAARMQVERSQAVLDLSKKLRWIPFLEIGVEGERDYDRSRSLGPTIAFELPLFGKSRSRVLRAEALQEQATAGVVLLEGQVANDIARTYARMQSALARVNRHRTGLIPQREAIVARTQELQNYMIVGQFELLLAKQEEYSAYEGYLATLRDYWKARVELSRAIGGALPSDSAIGELSESPIELPANAPKGMGHSGHNMQMMEGMGRNTAPEKHSSHGKEMTPTGEEPAASSHQHH
jgi:cobalt-zinc-cadmium efflux system outer membrane protein